MIFSSSILFAHILRTTRFTSLGLCSRIGYRPTCSWEMTKHENYISNKRFSFVIFQAARTCEYFERFHFGLECYTWNKVAYILYIWTVRYCKNMRFCWRNIFHYIIVCVRMNGMESLWSCCDSDKSTARASDSVNWQTLCALQTGAYLYCIEDMHEKRFYIFVPSDLGLWPLNLKFLLLVIHVQGRIFTKSDSFMDFRFPVNCSHGTDR